MDEDTRWLHSTLEHLLPGHSLTVWRGVTPLTGWWLVVCAKGRSEWQILVRHETIAARDDMQLTHDVANKKPIPL